MFGHYYYYYYKYDGCEHQAIKIDSNSALRPCICRLCWLSAASCCVCCQRSTSVCWTITVIMAVSTKWRSTRAPVRLASVSPATSSPARVRHRTPCVTVPLASQSSSPSSHGGISQRICWTEMANLYTFVSNSNLDRPGQSSVSCFE